VTTSQKIETIKAFLELHKDSNIDDWSARFQHVDMTDDEKHMHIYSMLEGGAYGEVCKNDDFDEYEIEISGSDSITGDSVMFTWPAQQEPGP